jgi:hypothetical protein
MELDTSRSGQNKHPSAPRKLEKEGRGVVRVLVGFKRGESVVGGEAGALAHGLEAQGLGRAVAALDPVVGAPEPGDAAGGALRLDEVRAGHVEAARLAEAGAARGVEEDAAALRYPHAHLHAPQLARARQARRRAALRIPEI